MKRAVTAFVCLGIISPIHPAEGTSMWGCAPVGQRQTVLHLADRGARSYIKFSGQRIASTHTTAETATGSEQTWSFGANKIVLSADGFATYIERGQVKTRFKCKSMN